MRTISLVHGIPALFLALALNAAWAYPTIPSSSRLPLGVHKGCAGDYVNCHAFAMQETTAVGHQLAAQAIFQIGNDSDVYITLSNASSRSGTYLPEEFLTGLFFNLKDTSGNLTSLTTTGAKAVARSATADANAVPGFSSGIMDSQGSTAGPSGAVASHLSSNYNGGEWQYQGSPGLHNGFNAGLSSTTLGGLFSTTDMNVLNIDPNAVNCTSATSNLDGCVTVTPDGGNNRFAIQDSLRLKFNLTSAQAAALDLSKKGALEIGSQHGSMANSGW